MSATQSLRADGKTPLSTYFHRTFVPGVLTAAKPSTRKQYRNAVVALCRWLRKDVRLWEINDPLVDDFRKWLLQDEGVSPIVARHYRHYIRRIVRTASPGICEMREPGRPRKNVVVPDLPAYKRTAPDEIPFALDVEGSLWRFYRTRYIPERMVGCAEKSIAVPFIHIRLFAKFLKRCPMVEDLKDETVNGFLQWILNNGSARATTNSARGSILALWRHAYRKTLLADLPRDVEKLREHRRLPCAWTMEEFQRLLQAAAETCGSISGIPAGKWWVGLLLFLYDTGARRRAAMATQTADVDLESGWVTVQAEVQKQKVEQRFRLSEQTLAAVLDIWDDGRDVLFPWSMNVRELYVRFGRILHRSGLPNDRRHKLHCIRRTSASHIAQVAGIDAAARHLGHSSAETTKRYIDPRFTAERDATSLLPRPKLGNGGAA